MKKQFYAKNLPLAVATLGMSAHLLRRALYALTVDQKNLLPASHPLKLALEVLSVAALIFIAISVWKLDGSNKYGDNFSAEPRSFWGHLAAAVGIGLTVLTCTPMMAGYLGTCWQMLGYLTPVCLVLAGLARKKGKQPLFFLHLIPCLFLVFHIVNHYQLWSGNPQFQDYVFTLFGTIALMLFAFYCTAFDADVGRRKSHLFMGLSAVYLLLAELAVTRYFVMYLGCILWVLTDLCSLTPVPKSESEKGSEKEK